MILAAGLSPAWQQIIRLDSLFPGKVNRAREVRKPEMAFRAEFLLRRNFPSQDEGAAALVELVDGLCRRLNIPEKLSSLGVRHEQLPEIVRGSRGNSMDGNPREMKDEELFRLLEDML